MHKERILIIVAVGLLAAGFLYWYLISLPVREAPVPTLETPVGDNIESADLGSALYEKSSNPVSGNLPDTVAPVVNPLEGVYKNPFK